MKIRNLIYYFSFILILIYSNSKAETILFDSKNIKIEENGNMIFATKGKARIPSNNLIIEGDKFIYNKSISELIVIDDVKYFDSENNIYIESQKIVYNEIENTIFSKKMFYDAISNWWLIISRVIDVKLLVVVVYPKTLA